MKTIFSIGSSNLAEYEKAAAAAAACGASHLVVTENLPIAQWQFDTPGDPYPSWFAFQPGLLKIFPAAELKPFIDLGHSERIIEILIKRCAILAKHGLGGVYLTTEPQILPEAVFESHPRWRGPRVDQPNRSRKARFAPCVGDVDVRQLYRRAMHQLVETCPEIDTFLFLTIDSGSGFCWAPALYPGANGCSRCHANDVEERAASFVNLLADAAREKKSDIEIDLVEIEPRSWMRKAFPKPAQLARQLTRGLSINHHEGPDGNRFLARRIDNLFFNAFYPVVGLPRPVNFLRRLIRDRQVDAPRIVCTFNDALNTPLNAAVFRAFSQSSAGTEREGLNLLHEVAGQFFSPATAETMVDFWVAIDQAEQQLASLDFGPFLLSGLLLARWITRPFVPFPEELTEEERDLFVPYLFQARDEKAALNLIDIQAMRMFEGWSGRLLVEQTLLVTDQHLQRALSMVRTLADDAAHREMAEASAHRLSLLRCLLRTGRNAVAYQAQLDRVKDAHVSIESAPPHPLGWPGEWEYHDLVKFAREEIDNTLAIIECLENSGEPILDHAPSGELETTMRLGPQVVSQLRQKVAIMNHKWLDYNRLFAPPNP